MDESFLAAIRAAPDDDLARLVYADYLEERGDAARAEFIRVQVELATLDEVDPRLAALEDRAHELLAGHEADWLRSAEQSSLTEWEFRRGFVDQAEIAFGVTAGGVKLERCLVTRLALSGAWYLPPAHDVTMQVVKSINFQHHHYSVDNYAGRPDLYPNVRDLALGQHFGWDRSPALIGRICQHVNLESISFHSRTFGDTTAANPAGLVTALGASRLTQLSLEDAHLRSAELIALLAAPSLNAIADLDIADNPLGPDAWRAFQNADPELRLRKLDVSGTPLAGISLGPLLGTPAVRDSLTHLDINGTGSARDNLESLADSGYWSRAESLRLRSATVPAMAFESLTRVAGPPNLRLLDLGDNYLRSDGVRMLAESGWAGSLTWLSLSENLLDDEALRIIAESGVFGNLRVLHLADNRDFSSDELVSIGDAGTIRLMNSRVMSRLRFITLGGTDVTDLAASQLLDGPHWNLAGLGLRNLDLSAVTIDAIAASPKLARLEWLDLSANPRLGGDVLMPLAESVYLTGLLELDISGIPVNERVQANLRARLGNRLTE